MSEREWYFYLDDMIKFSEQVLSYAAGFYRDERDEWDVNLKTKSFQVLGLTTSI